MELVQSVIQFHPKRLEGLFTGSRGLKSVWLQITSKCNQYCEYCYMNASRESHEFLSLDQIDTIFRTARELGARTMLISGGEPTIVKQLPAVLRRSVLDYGFRTYLVTNGSGLTPQLIDLLAELKVIVQVSMDSIDDGQYAKARGLPLLPRIKRNVIALVAANVETALSVPITNVVDDSVVGVLNWALEHTIQNVHVSTSYGQRTGVTKDLTRQAPADVLTELYEFEKEHYFELSIDLIENILLSATGLGESCSTYCTPMSGSAIEVTATGETYYCGAITSIPGMSLGNILHDDFVQNYSSRSRNRQHLSLTPDKVSVCSTCQYRRMCKGSCRSQALAYTGNLLGPVSHCEDLKRLYGRIEHELESGELSDLMSFLSTAYGDRLSAHTKCF